MITIITEQHAKAGNEFERNSVLRMLAASLIGTNGGGQWYHDGSVGFYVVRGSLWTGKITIDPLKTTSVNLPMEANDCIIDISVVSGISVTTTQEYISSATGYVLSSSLIGSKVILTINNSLVGK